MTEPRRRSYSAMTTYQECGEQYRLKYIERIPEQPAVWSVGGTAFHTVAERYLRGELDGPFKGSGLGQAWIDAWQEAMTEVITRHEEKAGEKPPPLSTWRKGGRGREGGTWWTDEGPRMVKQFHQWWTTGRGAALNVLELAGDGPALEQRLEVDLGDVPVVAIPDALIVDEHGQVDVLDYKTGRTAPKDPLQLSVYRAAVHAAYGHAPVWGLYYMARAGDVIPYDLSKGLSPDQIGDLFADFDTREKAGDYAPNPGKHCSYCGVRDHCIYKERR